MTYLIENSEFDGCDHGGSDKGGLRLELISEVGEEIIGLEQRKLSHALCYHVARTFNEINVYICNGCITIL